MSRICYALCIVTLAVMVVNPLQAKIDHKQLSAPKSINPLLIQYSKPLKDKNDVLKLKRETLELSGKSVPVLIKVMKSDKFPEKNRWIATFLLGRIMGKKAGPFIARFAEHPSWVMRLASLKTLLALKEAKLGNLYVQMLKDNSMIVRHQALDNIRKLGMTQHAPSVWAMLYDKKNYYQNKKKMTKRTNLIKDVILTIGDLKFQKAVNPLLSMIQKKKYQDIFDEMDLTLAKISGKQSPKGSRSVKKLFWKRYALRTKKI